MSEFHERLARNQTLFREVNERIETLADGEVTEFLCECSNVECASTIALSLAEYERIRSNPTWFVIKPDHDLPQIERVISRDEGYVVVDKFVAQEELREADPRADEVQEGSARAQPGFAGA